MVVSVNKKIVAAAAAASDPTPPQDPQKHNLELVRIHRYHYANTLYLRNTIYVFNEDGAKHMMALRDPQGLPVWKIAQPRVRMVQVPVDMNEETLRPIDHGRTTADLVDFLNAQSKPGPVGTLELGDAESEADLQARVAAADATLADNGETATDEIDTGAAVTVG